MKLNDMSIEQLVEHPGALKLRLVRWCDEVSVGCFGDLIGPGLHVRTVERPWRNNEPYVSNIPPGTYRIVATRYNRGGYDTIEIVGVDGRSLIKVHQGELPRHVQGCVAVGTTLFAYGARWGLDGTQGAFAEFAQMLTEWEKLTDGHWNYGDTVGVIDVSYAWGA